MKNTIKLKGCSPRVMMLHLKALGIFRIIAEQKDVFVKARWDNDEFTLQTMLNRDDLVQFFCDEYVPTPIVSPWNKDSIFSTEEKGSIISEIMKSSDKRLSPYKITIEKSLSIRKKRGYGAEAKNDEKNKIELIKELRNSLPESAISWIDTAVVTKLGNRLSHGPILVTGGNDGRVDISKKFAGSILTYIKDDKKMDYVHNSLFGSAVSMKEEGSAGPFYPGTYADNAASPINDKVYTLANPLDFILAMEGVLFFAGNMRRSGEHQFTSFPFSVRSSQAGYDTACVENSKERGELWIPMWNNLATCDELKYVFAEGRVQVTNKPARGVEFALALANFGAMKGIYAFQRFGVFERKGRSHHMIDIGRIHTAKNNTNGKMLLEIEQWLNRIRNMDKKPNSITSILHRIDDKIIRYCAGGNAHHLQEILIMIGKMERQLALSPRHSIPPLNSLSTEWINGCNVDTPEFRLAMSLGSIYSKKTHYPIRHNLEQVKIPSPDARKEYIQWKSKNPTVVWGRGDLVQNMIRVLERRCIDGLVKRAGIPLESYVYARVDDVIGFIEKKLNDQMIYDLVLPLSMINYRSINIDGVLWRTPDFVPELYACLKSNFPPVQVSQQSKNKTSRKKQISVFESSILGLLKSGQQNTALNIMHRRLKVSGYHTITYRTKNMYDRVGDETLRRLCAALLFPVHKNDTMHMLDQLTLVGT